MENSTKNEKITAINNCIDAMDILAGKIEGLSNSNSFAQFWVKLMKMGVKIEDQKEDLISQIFQDVENV